MVALIHELLESVKLRISGPTASPISGQLLARNHYDRVGRAFTAADLVLGNTHLVKPTVGQAALLAKTNRNDVHAALRQQDERDAIEAGRLPLFPKFNGNGHCRLSQGSLLAEATHSELVDLVRVIGVDRVLEAACAVESSAL
jgi:hypothetical protein